MQFKGLPFSAYLVSSICLCCPKHAAKNCFSFAWTCCPAAGQLHLGPRTFPLGTAGATSSPSLLARLQVGEAWCYWSVSTASGVFDTIPVSSGVFSMAMDTQPGPLLGRSSRYRGYPRKWFVISVKIMLIICRKSYESVHTRSDSFGLVSGGAGCFLILERKAKALSGNLIMLLLSHKRDSNLSHLMLPLMLGTPKGTM